MTFGGLKLESPRKRFIYVVKFENLVFIYKWKTFPSNTQTCSNKSRWYSPLRADVFLFLIYVCFPARQDQGDINRTKSVKPTANEWKLDWKKAECINMWSEKQRNGLVQWRMGTMLEFFLPKFCTNTTDMGGQFGPKSVFCLPFVKKRQLLKKVIFRKKQIFDSFWKSLCKVHTYSLHTWLATVYSQTIKIYLICLMQNLDQVLQSLLLTV